MSDVYIRVEDLNKWVKRNLPNREYVTIDDLINAIEDLDSTVENLTEKIEDLKQDIEENYKRIEVRDQIGE